MTSISLAHEHLYVFRKPAKGEKISEFKNSVKWRLEPLSRFVVWKRT